MPNAEDPARLFFDLHPDPMTIYDRETLEILAVNDAGVRLYGLSRQEFLKRRVSDFRVLGPGEAIQSALAATEVHDGVHNRARHRLVDGGERDVIVRAYPIPYQGRPCRITVITPIVDTEEAARTERRNNLLRRLVGQIARLGTWEIDSNRTMQWSDVTKQLIGVGANSAPTVDQALAMISRLDRVRVTAALDRCLTEGERIDQVCRALVPGRRMIWLRLVGEAERAADGRVALCYGVVQDVTELFTARERGAREAERLIAILAGIADPFLIVDRRWRLSYANSAASDAFGAWMDDEADGALWRLMALTPDAPVGLALHRAMTERAPTTLDWSDPRSGRCYQLSVYATGDGMAITMRDVSDARAQENERRLLEAAVERAQDLIFITAAQENPEVGCRPIIYANRAFHEALGRTPDEVIGNSFIRLATNDRNTTTLAALHDAAPQMGPMALEMWLNDASGEPFLVEGDASPVHDDSGTLINWIVILRKVTGQRLAEAERRIDNERFRMVAKATSDVLWDLDLATDKVWWNENLKTLFGYDSAAFAELSDGWGARIVPEERETVLASFHAAIDGGDTVWRSEYRFTRADGSIAMVMDRGFIIRDDSGRAVRMVGSMVDVTERRELDEQLRQAQKLESVGQLTGGLAHDFNNLLTVILGNAEALTAIASDDPDVCELARMTLSAAERGAELTNRLLAFARRQTLAPRAVDANELIAGMERLLKRTLSETVVIEFLPSSTVWPALVDPGQLEVALLNLALNARDAMPSGGMLSIGTANIVVDDNADGAEGIAPGNYIAISVTDTGIGMSRDIARRAFDPFFTTKEVGKGSGLGLSMVYGFAKQSGGTVRIDSRLGRGTSVTLYLPRAAQIVAEKPNAEPAPAMPTGDETILVVEDDTLVRNHASSLLRGLGYRVLSARDGREALSLLHAGAPVDLLFTDVVMPGGINGAQLADFAQELRPGLRVLFTSGYTEPRVFGEHPQPLEARLVRKPYRRHELALRIRAALDASDARLAAE